MVQTTTRTKVNHNKSPLSYAEVLRLRRGADYEELQSQKENVDPPAVANFMTASAFLLGAGPERDGQACREEAVSKVSPTLLSSGFFELPPSDMPATIPLAKETGSRRISTASTLSSVDTWTSLERMPTPKHADARQEPRTRANAVTVERRPDSSTRATWTLEASCLSRKDKALTSPEFWVDFAGHRSEPFKILITADSQKGGFNRADGHGRIELKWSPETTPSRPAPKVSFWIGVGGQPEDLARKGRIGVVRRGPVVHDFSDKLCCGLPCSDQVWDLQAAVDHGSRKLRVCVDLSIFHL